MTTNFFQTLNELDIQADWKITISRSSDNTLIVSAILSTDKVGDGASKLVPPMILKGTAQELDEGFFNAIAAPARKTAALFANMEDYAKAQERARLESKMEQDKKSKEEKQAKEAATKYDATMKKVGEQEEQHKYAEALMQLSKLAEQCPDKASDIEQKREQLWQKIQDKDNTLF